MSMPNQSNEPNDPRVLGELNDKSDLVNWTEIVQANFNVDQFTALKSVLSVYDFEANFETIIFDTEAK